MPKKLKTILMVVFGSAGAIAALLYGFNAWWLMTYGRSPQSIPSSILDIDKNFNFPPGFPPDPGKAGKETIQGLDADHDGIRDDVQRWIYAFVPNDPKKQKALRQMTRYYTEYALANDFTHDLVMRSNPIWDRALQCIYMSFSDGKSFYEDIERKYLKAKILNTYARVKRYWENNTKVTAQEMAGEHPDYDSPCDNQ